MISPTTFYRNSIIHGLYVHFLKPVFFLQDPEAVHDRMTSVGKSLGAHAWSRALVRGFFGFEDESLSQEIMGIRFANPIGLSAGFDKNAELVSIMPSVGFGFTEIGSVTGNACAGNPKPRLWRLPKSEGLVVWYGLKNDGCEEISERLAGKHFDIPVGASVAMTNCAENLDLERAIHDFAKAFRAMEPIGSYITVNISCPNAQGGQTFTDPAKLDRLFDVLDEIPTEKPVFIKLSPDLSHAEIDAILDVAKAHRIHGIIATNLTKKRDNPKIKDSSVPKMGGVSGKAVGGMSDDMLAYVSKREGKRFLLIASGGVFTAEDAYRKIRLGASLVQMITGMIFEGPQVVSEINRGIAELLKRDGYTNIGQAVGADAIKA